MAQPNSVLQQKGAQLARNPVSGNEGKHLGQNLSFGLSVFAADTWTAGDAIKRLVTRTRSAVDVVPVTDSAFDPLGLGFATNDSFVVSDQAGRVTSGLTESITITDSARAGRGTQTSANDATVVRDVALDVRGSGFATSDGWAVADAGAVTAALKLSGHDTVPVADGPVGIGIGARDSVPVSDSAGGVTSTRTVVYTDLPTTLAVEGTKRTLTLKSEPTSLAIKPEPSTVAVQPEPERVLIDG